MTDYFFDTSALVKRYFIETGSEWVRNIAEDEAHTISISLITRVEVASAVARRVRDGLLPDQAVSVIQKQLKLHIRDEYVVVSLIGKIIESAVDLIYNYPLRSYDAVQLASGLDAHQRSMVAYKLPVVFVSSDHRLLSIASTVGLPIEDPNVHP